MHARRPIYLTLAGLLVVGVAQLPSTAQTNGGSSNWETLRPEGEEFAILMPKNSTSESSTFPYHKMELNTRLYISASPSGAVLAVASFSGIKSNPALYSDFERFNSYVDAFKNWFPAKARPGFSRGQPAMGGAGKDSLAKLTLAGDSTFHGHPARNYRLTMGDLDGVVRAYTTRKRFYAVVILNTKKDDSLQETFLSSFVLPDRTPDAPKVVASKTNDNTSATSPAPGSQSGKPNGEASKTDADGIAPAQPRPGENNTESNPQAKDAPSTKRAPISGGMLNGKAIYLPLPEFPPGDASGVVAVSVLIDEQGIVVDAHAVSGPPALQAAALNAARFARFSPTTMMGEAVKVTGILTFNFAR